MRILDINEPEEIHTYAFWKNEYGLVPKKGSHAVATLQMKKSDEENDIEKMFLTKVFFFIHSQLEPINNKDKI